MSTPTAGSASAAAVVKKLHGYDFFRAIGSPTRIAAPMVDQSELPFRMLCRDYGAQLCFTPMLHARVALESPTYLRDTFTTCAADRPLIAQFCGNDPETILAAARLVQHTVDAVDINLGCPQGIARRGRYGAFLLEETALISRIVSTLAAGLAVPVTAKIRLLASWEATLQLVLALQAAGASMITVHGRTREQNKERVLAADWDAIRRLKQHPSVAIPIVANGGVACTDDVEACLATTTADAVMSSEALLEDPGLFSRRVREATGAVDSSFDIALRYLDYTDALPGADAGCIKAHLMRMLFGVWERFPALRAQLVAPRSEGGGDYRGVVLAARSAHAVAFGAPPRLRPAALRRAAAGEAGGDSPAAASVDSVADTAPRGSSDPRVSASTSAAAADAAAAQSVATTSPPTRAGQSIAAPEGGSTGTETPPPAPPAATSDAGPAGVLVCAGGETPACADDTDRRVSAWECARRADAAVGWAHPAYGGDPALPGRWYMRYRQDVFGMGKPAVVPGYEHLPPHTQRAKRGRADDTHTPDAPVASAGGAVEDALPMADT